jgi:serine/threonine-protein kinase
VWTLLALATDILGCATVTHIHVSASEDHECVVVGRYLLHRQIARGGMATIHLAHLIGDVGFSRIVAAKRLHPELAENSEFVAMFLDEARIASKVHHRNIVPVLDVVTAGGEVVLVQELVRGAPLARLLQTAAEARSHVPLPIAASIACQVLAGLHAAHETTDELGTPLEVVHRDVSPQNIMVATDGTARLLDFGVAKAAMAAHVTRRGTFKGKLGYSAPEHIRGHATQQSDIYSLSVVLWELVTGQRMHRSNLGITRIIERVMANVLPTLTEQLADERAFISGYRWQQLEVLAPIVAKGLAGDPHRRWQTAADMEEAISAAVPVASGSEVAEWVGVVAKDLIDERERMIAEEEATWRRRARHPSPAPLDLAIPMQADIASGPAVALELRPSMRVVAWVKEHTTRSAAMFGAALSVLVLAIALAWPHHPASAPADDLAPAEEVRSAEVLWPLPRASAPPPGAVAALPPPTDQCASAAASTAAAAPAAPPPQPPPQPAPQPPQPAPTLHTIAHPAPPQPAPRKAAPPAKRIAPAPPPPAPPPPLPPATPHVAPKPAVDCNPPYYFVGAKKVFKPACV